MMDTRIFEIAERIRGLRSMLEISAEDAAKATGVTPEEFIEYEQGSKDFGFTFLYKCAELFGVDIVELLTGENPKLMFYSVVRKGEGLDMKRRAGFTYEHMAYKFRDKLAETFLVTAPYSEKAQTEPIELSYHKGQEMDYIISGQLRVRFENHEEVLNPGDVAYYDSGRGHGMIACGGQPCTFIAVVIRGDREEKE